MSDPLETYFKFCLEAVQECGLDAGMTTINQAVQKRLDALPKAEKDAIDAKVKLLTSFTGPGFHEKGPH